VMCMLAACSGSHVQEGRHFQASSLRAAGLNYLPRGLRMEDEQHEVARRFGPYGRYLYCFKGPQKRSTGGPQYSTSHRVAINDPPTTCVAATSSRLIISKRTLQAGPRSLL